MPGTTRSGGDRSLSTDKTPNDGPPIKPDNMTARAQDKWGELLEQIPTCLLRQIDVHQLRLLAELLAQSDALAERIEDAPSDDKATRLYLATIDRVARLSGMFGLSPNDRKRSQLEPAPEDDATLAELLTRLSRD
jgi:hypothetical protein